jgi:hypothetical protein
MTSNGNLESALAGGISKGIREGVGASLPPECLKRDGGEI